jgi:hypothetical protein
MQFKSEYVFTIISIMFNSGDKKLTQIIKLTQILKILKKIFQKDFIKIFQKIL